MKHIYLINSTTRAAQYGIGTYIKQMQECLKGNDAFCLSLIEINSDVREFKVIVDKRKNIRRLLIPGTQTRGTLKDNERFYRNIIYLLAPYISSSEKNIFHFNSQYHYSLFDLLKSKWPDAIVVLTIHYLNWCFVLKGNKTQFREIIQKSESERNPQEKLIATEYASDQKAFEKADKVICLCQYTEELLETDYGISGNKIEVIYNGLKEKSISWNKSIRLRRKRQLLFGDNERVILFVGRLDDIKGVEYLIRAFRLLLEKIPESRLVIVGEGKYDTFLKECVHIWHRVTFTGKLDQKTLQRFYQIADVGVMPSFHEQCSYVAIEMMMYGIPLIGTDSTGLKEMLGDNQKYMMKIFEEANNVSLSVENLAHTLVQLLTESFPRKAGKNGRLIFEHKFSLSVMKDKMLAFYGRL